MIRDMIPLCAALVAAYGSDSAPSEESPPAQADPSRSSMIKDCGASCVAIVGNLLGVDEVPFERAKELVDPDGDGLASMLDLVHGLTSLGIASSSMQSSSLAVPDGVNILHVSATDDSSGEDHFIVSEELPDGRFRFYCPPLGTKTGEGTALEGMWSGRFVRVGTPKGRSWWGAATVAAMGLLAGALVSRLARGARRGREVVDA